ncbi:LysE family transporter [Nakamurella aerolata]|uniref:Amino acid transporter n=1 Tax=Nakamurella aerolata TaxID=1656892 RepID=A0A849A4X6_9ACTN|nr:amino acid transporter [Nakamurella aerolata]
MTSAVAGLLTGLSLIVAIGAQNAYVLRQGLLRQHVGVVVLVCALADVLLIAAGVAGVGAVVAAHPQLLNVLRWAGAGYLVWFGVRSLRSALRPGSQALQADVAGGRGPVLATALALTFLNPHVYLDTVVFLGSISNQYGGAGRWWFGLGAAAASIGWFTGLGFGARSMSGLLKRPATWRVVDVLVALTMFAVAAMLLLRR